MLPPSSRPAVADLCRELDRRLRSGEPARAEDYLTADWDPEEALELVYTEFVCREERGSRPEPAEFFRRFPALRSQLEEQFLVHRALHDGPAPAGGSGVGPYELVREVGRGARGAVFEARDRRDGRTVAVKLLLSGEYSTTEDLAQFRHEAAVLTRLDHPNLIRLYEAGVDGGRPYLALEFVAGPPLSRAGAAVQPPAVAAALLEAVARAVHYAHTQGVVHRDLKPGNILLQAVRGEGSGVSADALTPLPKVTDFGLARVLGATSGRTRTGDIVGTLGYMAPEQAAGAAHRAGPGADIYALGAILYELLTGHPPFGPDPSAAALYRLLHEPPPAPRRLAPTAPRDLETVVLKCLEKRPVDRYPSALALAEDLRRYLDGQPVRARRVGAARAARRWALRRPAAAALIAVTALAAVGLAAGGVYHHMQLTAALSESEKLRGETAAANADLKDALDDARRGMYAQQLAQLPALWLREPVRARQLLADERVCPPDLHDFTWRYFRGLCSLDERVADAHRGGTLAVAFRPDGGLVTGGADGRLRYWSAAGEGGAAVAAHGGPVNAVVGAGGDVVVTGGRDRAVKVWAGGAKGPLRTITAPAGVNALAAAPEQGLVAAACDDGRVRVWEVATGSPVSAHGATAEPLLAVAFGPGGTVVAAAGRDGVVRRYDVPTGALTAEWDAREPVLGLAFAPDGGFVVSTGERGGVRVWDAKSGRARELRGHLMPVRGVAVSPAGDRIATGGGDTYLKVWDAATGQELTNVMRGHVGAVAWSPDGKWIAGGSREGRLTVYRLPCSPPPVAFPHPANVGTLAARPGGGLVTADATGAVRVWEAGGAPAAQFAVRPHDAGPDRPQAVVGNGAPALAVSPDGATLAVGAGGGEVVLWDPVRRAEVARLSGHAGNVAAVAWSPDGRTLATGGADNTVRLWDAAARKTTAVLTGHTRGVLALAWSPDGRRLASGGEDNTVAVWSAADGRKEHTLTGHAIWVLGLAFHPNGRTLVSGSRDRTARVWDAVEGRPLATLSGYTNWVYSVGYSPDGRTLATASGHYGIDSPGEIKLFDPDAGYVRAILTDVRAPAAFDPTGGRLFVGVRGGVAELVGR